jgi:sigma-B regulation protein RsbU (phosphoserine phosphatase)
MRVEHASPRFYAMGGSFMNDLPESFEILSEDAMQDPVNQVKRLERVLEISRRMAATTDLDELLAMIVDAGCEVLRCDRVSIFLYDADRNELFIRMARGVDSIRFPADKGIAGAAAQDRSIVNVPDAYADPRFNSNVDRETGYHTRNLLALPLENLDGRLMGVLQALNKHTGPFDSDDEALAETFGAQLGVALHRGVLLEEFTEKQRLDRELDIAREIQQALFPDKNPTFDNLDIAGWNRSADATGGDAYDFIPLPDGRWAILLADATGHGIGAALNISQCRSVVRALLSITDDLGEIAQRVNNLMAADTTGGRFVTAFLGILDPKSNELRYIAAGQAPILFLDPNEYESRPATGLPLAVMPDAEFDVEKFNLSAGTCLALLTDGFFEAADEAGELYGEQRVVEVLRKAEDRSAADQITALQEAIDQYSAGLPQADDLTAVLIVSR